MIVNRAGISVLISLIVFFSTEVFAQIDSNYFRPNAERRGSLFLHGGGRVTREQRERFAALAGGKDAKIVVIPTAGYNNDVAAAQIKIWRELSPASVFILHAESRDAAMQPTFCEPLQTATGVWITGGEQMRLADTYLGTPVEQALYEVVARGGVVGGRSAGAAIATRVMINCGEERKGFDLLPMAVVDQHFLRREREPRLRKILSTHPDHVGFGIDEGTALVVQGDKLSVIGESSVTVMLARGNGRPEQTELLTATSEADLIAFNSAAIARQKLAVTPVKMSAPSFTSGSPMIVNSGKMPTDSFSMAASTNPQSVSSDKEIVVSR